MPVQISESGFQQRAFAIEASGTSQGDATEVPVGVSVVNITSKFRTPRWRIPAKSNSGGLNKVFERGLQID